MSKGIERLVAIRKEIPPNKSIALVGGAFDLIHPGHLHAIDYAKRIGDVVVVSVLPDSHIKSYKGDQRPILSEDHRLRMVESLKPVDHAFIPDENSYSLENLDALKPDHLVYGMENDEERRAKQEVQKARIRERFPNIDFHDLERFPDQDVSTTALIRKIKSL